MSRVGRYRSGPSYAAMAGAVYRNVPSSWKSATARAAAGEIRRQYKIYNKSEGKYKAKGGAAPLLGKSVDFQRRRRKRRATAKKCRKMKGYALKKEVCKLSNAVKELKHSENASLAMMTHRRFESGTLRAIESQQAQSFVTSCSNVLTEAILANLKYYDPSNPATLLTAAGAVGSYQKDFLMKSSTSKLLIKNNYITDVELTVYLCVPKKDTASGPSTAWADGIAADPGNITSAVQYGSYPTDYELFRDMWSAKRIVKKCLSPGQSTSCSHTTENIEYDPALTDEQTQLFQRSQGAFGFLIVISGQISHDPAVAGEQGVNASGIDYQLKHITKVQYDAGINLTYVVHDDNQNSSTNGFVESHNPIADNQAYSVA